MMWQYHNKVAVSFTGEKGYPTQAPFHPPERYPELGDGDVDPDNRVYRWVRETLYRLGLDRENFNTPNWNPLHDIVKPATTVFIKPNTVRHHHLKGKDIFSVITHASVVRPILDYVLIALQGDGRIIVGDSQVVFGRFDEAMAIAGLAPLLEWHRRRTSIPTECFDLRTERAVRTWLGGKWGREKVEHDPRGYQVVDLDRQSCFRDIDPKKLRIGISPRREMFKHHSGGRHEYLFPKSVLQSDTIISIPKLKTHRRTAVTLTLKGFVGLVAGKESLPHYMVGSPQEGGDEYLHPSIRKRLCSRLHDGVQSGRFVPLKLLLAVARRSVWSTRHVVPFKDDVTEAKWYGNDTLWRTLLDLYRAVFYADKNGRLCEVPQRNHFCLLDGIVAGERNGPVAPDPVAAGVLLAGLNPVAVDAVAASLMGFDVSAIPTIHKALAMLGQDGAFFDRLEIIDNGVTLDVDAFLSQRNLDFVPHPQWQGHVERGSNGRARAAIW